MRVWPKVSISEQIFDENEKEKRRNKCNSVLKRKTKKKGQTLEEIFYSYLGSTGKATGYCSGSPIPAILATSPAHGPAALTNIDASIG